MTKANKEARKERHQKLFEGQYHSRLGKFMFYMFRGTRRAAYFFKPSRKKFSRFMHPLDHLPAPKRLYTQMVLWSVAFLMLTSVNVSARNFGEGLGAEYVDLALEIDQSFITDEEGYLIKSMPLEGVAVYDQNRTEIVKHEVQSGETISEIAYRYGISSSSIKYANSGLNINRVRVGTELSIPPKDGLYVEVDSGDTILELVEDYDGDIDATLEFNQLTEDSGLTEGKDIFIVDGEPQQTYVAATPVYTAPASSSSGTAAAPSVTHYDLPASASGWVRPTSGIITQGYHSYHLAYDVADRSKPPVLAAAGGTIVKASSGTWGGGYGNHIIIDHGNGYRTLYAHNEVLYVSVGDYVDQGQVIAKMGNTGRVYGATGIHLHFEISYNGVKQSPSIMGVW